MKKTSRPFSVETRHASHRSPRANSRIIPESRETDAPGLSEARQAADALFAPAPLPQPEQPVTAPTRRVLPALDQKDHIARLLEEEDAHRPRRGRKPAGEDELAPLPQGVRRPEREPVTSARRIAGYMRGRIFARYARRTEPAPGHYWRKRVTPAW